MPTGSNLEDCLLSGVNGRLMSVKPRVYEIIAGDGAMIMGILKLFTTGISWKVQS